MDNGTYVVEDDVFTYQTKRGTQVVVDLDIPADVFKRSTAEDAVTEEQQFAAVKEWISDDSQRAFDGMGALERARFYSTFFSEWQKAAGLPLGESHSSSPSSRSTTEN